MPRPRAIIPKRGLHTTIPADLSIQLDTYLWSDLEGRVPQGAVQTLLITLLREFFSHPRLDLAPYLDTPSNFAVIQGSPETLLKLRTLLETPKDIVS